MTTAPEPPRHSSVAPDAPPRAVDIFLHHLKCEGVEVVFGIPGGLLYPFFDTVEADPDIRLVVSRHEEGAAFMADGYARTSGRLSVCAATGGPGATNLLTGVACAFADGVPMLVLTGQAASHALGKGAAQETSREDIDIVSIFRPVSKYSAMVTSASKLSHHLRRALRLALTGRPGPVHLNVPVDVWERALTEEWFDPSTYRPPTSTFDRDAVTRASGLLLEARHPVILAGAGTGISGAAGELASVAELLGARVATTPRGKGLFPEDHPLSLGVLGIAGHAQASETLFGDQVDVLMTVGASLNETTTTNWNDALLPSKALLQCDIEPDPMGRNYPVDVPLLGDARTILGEIESILRERIRGGAEPGSLWAEAPALAGGEERYRARELRDRGGAPMAPQRWRRLFNAVLPDDAIVFSDIGGHMLFNLHHLDIRSGQSFVLNLGFGSMGHGTVAPIGAALAHPNRPVFAIIGDACMTMNGMELLTARACGARVVWLIENNNMHGVTWHASQRLGHGGRGLASVVYDQPLDVAAIARGMGLPAWVVDAPECFEETLAQAVAAAPSVIELRVDASIPPPMGGRVKSLAGFIRERSL